MMESLRNLEQVKRVPYIQEGAENLGQFVGSYLKSFKEELDRLRRGEIDRENFTRHILIFVAVPSSGKSHFIRETNLALVNWKLELGDSLGYQKVLKEIKYGNVTWERAQYLEIKAAEKEGRDHTPPEELFNDEELALTEDIFKKLVSQAIRRSLGMMVEVPAGAAALVNNIWIGRLAGARTLNKLAHREEIFKKALPYELWMAGLVGNLFLHEVMVYARDGFRKAKTLEEAQEIAEIFGKKPPETIGEWNSLKEGASAKTTIFYDEKVEELRQVLIKNGLSYDVDYSVFKEVGAYDLSQGLTSKHQILSDFTIYASGEVLRYIFENNLRIPAERRFIGLNNPRNNIDTQRLREYLTDKTDYVKNTKMPDFEDYIGKSPFIDKQ